MIKNGWICMLLPLALAAPTQSPASGALSIVTVGESASCDIRSDQTQNPIQLAIDAGADIIRLERDIDYPSQLFLIARTLTIRGGYSDCAAAANGIPPEPAARSLLSAAQLDQPVLRSIASEPDGIPSIRLENLELRPGQPAPPLRARAIYAQGIQNVSLTRVVIRDFQASGSGAAAFLLDQAWLFLAESTLTHNTAVEGGAVYCDAGAVFVDSTSFLLDNQAEVGDGGAIRASNCRVQIDGAWLPGDGSPANLSGNSAAGSGGAVFAGNNSLVYARGTSTCAPTVRGDCETGLLALMDNHAAGKGGALALATGARAWLDLVHIESNQARLGGGALFAASGSTLNVGSQIQMMAPELRSNLCPEGICQMMRGNRVRNATDTAMAGFGGAIAVDDAIARISDTAMIDNAARDAGTVHLSQGAQATFTQVLINGFAGYSSGSGYAELIAIQASELELMHGSIQTRSPMSSPTLLVMDSSLSMNHSYLRHANPQGISLSTSNPQAVAGSCNAYTGSLDGQAPQGIAVSATAADASTLIPDTDSALVDRCDELDPPLQWDIRGKPRAIRFSDNPLDPAVDIGAFEVPIDLLFFNGFEAAL